MKRKIGPLLTKSATQRWEEAFEAVADDDIKLEMVLQYVDKLQESSELNFTKTEWTKTQFTTKFCSLLNIVPKPDNENPLRVEESPFLISLLSLYQQFQSNKLSESISLFKECQQNMIKELALPPHNNTEKALFSLLSALERLERISFERNLGEGVVSGAMISLLDVICTLKGHKQNEDKQNTVILDNKIKSFNVRNDGLIQTEKDYVYCRREDTSFDDRVDWEYFGTDAYKLIISMKSQLKQNMNTVFMCQEEINKYSKVLGLCYTKLDTFVFILDAQINKKGNENIPEYSLYFQRFDMKLHGAILLFTYIMQFILQYVPSNIFTTITPFRPTNTPNKLLIPTGQLLSDILSSKRCSKISKHGKVVLKKHEDEKNERVNYVLQSNSFLKVVSPEEKEIILKLISNSCYCMYLPQILNVYKNDVEFEKLNSLPEKMSEKDIMALAIDISIALNHLHGHNIIHRDVKPDNIMTRALSDPSSFMWFVLIDFGLSLEFVEKNGIYFYKNSGTEINENLGTSIFKAPEVAASQPYTEKCDIYSLGASLLYLKNESVFLQLWRQGIKNIPTNMLKTLDWDYTEFGDIIRDMVADDPKIRPSAENIENRLSTLFQNCINLD